MANVPGPDPQDARPLDPPKNMFSLMGNPDVLIHLAWQGLPNYKSLHHFESELPVQYDFLSTLIKEGLQSIVVVGTCFEYGMQSNSLSEKLNTNPLLILPFTNKNFHMIKKDLQGQAY